MIHTDPNMNLYQFRGFDRYTPELPPDPPVPADDIIFWWTGMKDEYGLPKFDYYGGKDYTKVNDAFYYCDKYPKTYVGNKIIEEATASIKYDITFYPEHTGGTEGIGIVDWHSSGEEINLSKGRIGLWVKVNEAWIANSGSVEVDNIGTNGGTEWGIFFSIHYDEIYLGTTRSGIYARFPFSLFADTSYWIEVSYDVELETPIARVWVNNIEIACDVNLLIQTLYSSPLCLSYLGFKISHDENNKIEVQNVIISTDPTVNFYEKGYHLLTEYPKNEEGYEKIHTL